MTDAAAVPLEPGPKTLLIQRWSRNAAGEAVAEPVFTVEDEHDDGPDFFVQRALHADGVICVEVSRWVAGDEPDIARGWEVAARRCDPELDVEAETGRPPV